MGLTVGLRGVELRDELRLGFVGLALGSEPRVGVELRLGLRVGVELILGLEVELGVELTLGLVDGVEEGIFVSMAPFDSFNPGITIAKNTARIVAMKMMAKDPDTIKCFRFSGQHLPILTRKRLQH